MKFSAVLPVNFPVLNPSVLRRSILMSVTIVFNGSLIAQQHAATANRQATAVSVPFVGCRSDGQGGPRPAANGRTPDMAIEAEAARRLAYYSLPEGFGVLAPRGWYCIGMYDPGGESLYISPEPLVARMFLSNDWGSFLGTAIQLKHRRGEKSGQFEVADLIARVFPSFKSFAIGAMNQTTPPRKFSFHPYPSDVLTYKGKDIVEYHTPGNTEGIGTGSSLKKNDTAIDGVAILVGRTPDLLLLSVRLPLDSARLTSVIIRQVEREAAHRPQPKTVQ